MLCSYPVCSQYSLITINGKKVIPVPRLFCMCRDVFSNCSRLLRGLDYKQSIVMYLSTCRQTRRFFCVCRSNMQPESVVFAPDAPLLLRLSRMHKMLMYLSPPMSVAIKMQLSASEWLYAMLVGIERVCFCLH